MRIKVLILIFLVSLASFSSACCASFIKTRGQLKQQYDNPNALIIASTGRSGSTMLTEQFARFDQVHEVFKTHLLPPDKRFLGKIVFIFSNPDQAAESALYLGYDVPSFAPNHFLHVETADRNWLKKIGGIEKQTEAENLLSYDALGVYEHLKEWLYTQTKPSSLEHAQILAVKYENLWDKNTLDALKQFLDIPEFKLPAKKPRGSSKRVQYPKAIAFKKIYNLGTEDDPRYAAYADARILWEEASPFQYLKITHSDSGVK